MARVQGPLLRLRPATAIVWLAICGLAPGAARAEVASADGGGSDTTGWTIGADQEATIGRILDLGPGAGGWRLDGADVRFSRIEVTYRHHPSGETARLTLVHPSAAPDGAPRTEQMAIVASETPLPSALSRALLAAVRRQEAAFSWSPPPDPKAPETGRHTGESADLANRLSAARYALDTEDHALALEHLESALELGADSFWARREAGFILRRLGAHDRARAELEASLALLEERAGTEGHTPAMKAIARSQSLIGLDRVDEASSVLAPILEDGSPEAACQITRAADDLLRIEATDVAFALLERVLDRNPDCADGYVVLAHVARATGRGAEALPRLEAGAKRLPDDPAVVSQLADAYKILGRTQEAIDILDDLVGRGHDDPSIIASLLGIYTREWPSEEVIAGFRARADADPDDYIAAFFTGVFLHYSKSYADSTEYFERMRHRLPSEPRVYIYLAMNAFRLGEQEEAVEHIEHAVSLDHPDPDVYYCRAEILMDVDPPGALRDLERYLALTEGAPDSFPPKQEMVRNTVAALAACLDAPVPTECMAPAAGVDADDAISSRAPLVVGFGVGLAVLCALVVASRRRGRRAETARTDS